MRREMVELHLARGRYLAGHPERFPLKIVFWDDGLPYKEAKAKFEYLRFMNRRSRNVLIKKQRWHYGVVLLRLYDKYHVEWMENNT